ncbi:MAG TPA: hypothetical protein VD971_10225 [Phycisphaerales bacterium]|nr:hypothetical protein [Phycisphaerales bacterium]
MRREPRPNPVAFDPAWLFLVAGIVMLGALTLVASQREVDEARAVRDRTLAVEQHRTARLARYEEFLAALDQQSPALIESLASSQLNMIPASRAAIPGMSGGMRADASIFPSLEPPPLRLPSATTVDSTLVRLVRSEATRLWLLAGSVVLILVGLLPASRGWAHPGRRHPYLDHNDALLHQ